MATNNNSLDRQNETTNRLSALPENTAASAGQSSTPLQKPWTKPLKDAPEESSETPSARSIDHAKLREAIAEGYEECRDKKISEEVRQSSPPQTAAQQQAERDALAAANAKVIEAHEKFRNSLPPPPAASKELQDILDAQRALEKAKESHQHEGNVNGTPNFKETGEAVHAAQRLVDKLKGAYGKERFEKDYAAHREAEAKFEKLSGTKPQYLLDAEKARDAVSAQTHHVTYVLKQAEYQTIEGHAVMTHDIKKRLGIFNGDAQGDKPSPAHTDKELRESPQFKHVLTAVNRVEDLKQKVQQFNVEQAIEARDKAQTDIKELVKNSLNKEYHNLLHAKNAKDSASDAHKGIEDLGNRDSVQRKAARETTTAWKRTAESANITGGTFAKLGGEARMNALLLIGYKMKNFNELSAEDRKLLGLKYADTLKQYDELMAKRAAEDKKFGDAVKELTALRKTSKDRVKDLPLIPPEEGKQFASQLKAAEQEEQQAWKELEDFAKGPNKAQEHPVAKNASPTPPSPTSAHETPASSSRPAEAPQAERQPEANRAQENSTVVAQAFNRWESQHEQITKQEQKENSGAPQGRQPGQRQSGIMAVISAIVAAFAGFFAGGKSPEPNTTVAQSGRGPDGRPIKPVSPEMAREARNGLAFNPQNLRNVPEVALGGLTPVGSATGGGKRALS